ncbi:tRNA (guanosine(37)-N1)-methyltransferase TrmD [Mucisphaera sp.]|uniref:tRNA (guanosine(37)-N1)-methyltransferase TrmD n=1 Tax=Mucisphaera sp. TaxID=2913024 RepID=UPI003D11D583
MAQRIDILTLFPEMFASVLGSSILKRAAEPIANPADPSLVREPVVSYHLTNIRDHTDDKHQKVDQPPFGGGPGMVIQCQPVFDAVKAAESQDPRPARRILMTPQGRPLTQKLVDELAQEPRLLILAGHYEGIDERVIEELSPVEEISLGDYVLSGGELPAMVLIDAVVRRLPGALGHEDSASQDSFTEENTGLLEGPAYTRPRVWREREVPEVLLSGDHAKIAAWRREQSLARTRDRRPDLLGGSDAGAAGSSEPVVIRAPREADWPDLLSLVADDALRAGLERLVREDELIDARIAVVGERPVGFGGLIGVGLADQPSLRGLLAVEPLVVFGGGSGLRSVLVAELVEAAREAGAAGVLDRGEAAERGFEGGGSYGLECKDNDDKDLWIYPLRSGKLETLRGGVIWPDFG